MTVNLLQKGTIQLTLENIELLNHSLDKIKCTINQITIEKDCKFIIEKEKDYTADFGEC